MSCCAQRVDAGARVYSPSQRRDGRDVRSATGPRTAVTVVQPWSPSAEAAPGPAVDAQAASEGELLPPPRGALSTALVVCCSGSGCGTGGVDGEGDAGDDAAEPCCCTPHVARVDAAADLQRLLARGFSELASDFELPSLLSVVASMVKPVTGAVAGGAAVGSWLTPSTPAARALLSLLPYDAQADAPVDAAGVALNVALFMAFAVALTCAFAALFGRGTGGALRALVGGAFAAVFACAVGLVALQLSVDAGAALDAVTLALLCANGAAVGVAALFCAPPWQMSGDASDRLGKVVLVAGMVALSWPFMVMPAATLWATLLALVAWDLFAVLAPCGPLAYILRVDAQRTRRGEESELPPGLVYEDNRFRLGTGDLLVYSAMAGRAVQDGWLPGVACAAGVLVGAAATVAVTLVSTRQNLPALPLAVALGAACYLLARYVLVDYVAAAPLQSLLAQAQ